MRRRCRLVTWRCPPPPVEILEEPRALQCDLDELGDSVASVLLERAERCFLRWQVDPGERYTEQALTRVQESLERRLSLPHVVSRATSIFVRGP